MEPEMSPRELVKHAEMAETMENFALMSPEHEAQSRRAQTFALIAIAKSLQNIDQTLTRIHGHMRQNS